MQKVRDVLDRIKVKHGNLETRLGIIQQCLLQNNARRLERLLKECAATLPADYCSYFSSVLAEAALLGHHDIVGVMIRYNLGGGIHCQTHALMHAVQNDDLAMCKLLLGASTDVSMTDCSGDGLLAIAAWRNSAIVVPALVAAGCKLNVFNKGCLTPLHIATRLENLEVQCVLLQHGADPDLRDTSMMYGYSPLELAIMSSNRESIRNLLVAGCKVDMRRLNDRTFVKNVFETDPGIEEMMLMDASQPRTLMETCRRKIRYLLRPSCVAKAELLPLPKAVTEFIKMSREFTFDDYKLHLKGHDLTLITF